MGTRLPVRMISQASYSGVAAEFGAMTNSGTGDAGSRPARRTSVATRLPVRMISQASYSGVAAEFGAMTNSGNS